MLVPPQNTLLKWGSGPQRHFGTNPSKAPTTVGATQDKDLRGLPVWTQFESTTCVAGLYASSPQPTGPCKLPKLERIEVTATDATPPSTLKRMMASAFHAVRQTSPLSHEATETVPAIRRNRIENNSNCVPMAYEMAFRPTPEMELTMEQTKLANQISCICLWEEAPFGVLFRYGGFSIPRGVFMSLVPPWTPHTNLINTASMIGSMVASKLMAPHIWYFPSNLADEVLSGATMDRLQAAYTLPWMPETNNLHYVFVPIWEPADVWYLIMLDVKESRVYAFDVNKTPDSIIRREANMTRICRMLGKLFMLNRNLVNFRHGNPNPANWGNFHYPAGLPTDVDSLVSLLAPARRRIQSEDIQSFGMMVDADTVRMKAAIKIIQSVGNEEGGSIDVRSQINWLDVISFN
ncbi:hypothetical protein Ahy_B01g054949 [Arachis hypogaea]|uniref:Ubiquitin-like protease family profile domain-containing protein n=1 Tax=Arachis hypogaea TaxID=3818 RepID=A0A445AUL5_ARAHY|nr:hypothetical protein Ahy_B01g054949 [Arachis hypogaea]